MTEAAEKVGEAQEQDPCITTHGRFAAGEDPVKREQILDGARSIFMKVGFDAASMNDITREAGVSKGTVYVYFSGKEELFAALIEREKNKVSIALREILADNEGVEDALYRFAVAFVQQITGTDMIPAMRSLLGVIDRMPGLCRRFFSASPANAQTVLKDYLDQQVAEARLVIADTDLASRQFIDLSSGSFFRRRLLQEITASPPQAEIDRFVRSAVSIFMLVYGPRAENGASSPAGLL